MELTHASSEERPSHSAGEAAGLLVQTATARPELDGTQRGAEAASVRHAARDRGRHARAVQRVHIRLVHAASQQPGRLGRELARNLR